MATKLVADTSPDSGVELQSGGEASGTAAPLVNGVATPPLVSHAAPPLPPSHATPPLPLSHAAPPLVPLAGPVPQIDETESPTAALLGKAKQFRCNVEDEEFALRMDDEDPLRDVRSHFHYPLMSDLLNVDPSVCGATSSESIYLCGQSLGLQPKAVTDQLNTFITSWAKYGVQGHMNGELPWAYCDEYCVESSAKLVGAKPEEIAIMNGLSVNLHLMLISFYRPTAERYKILLESKAFPSDHYIVESQMRLHGLEPSECMICVEPRQGESCLRDEDIIDYINMHGQHIALVLLPGVQYYTGQMFDIQAITRAVRDKGCVCGWDLAHAVGNTYLHLHDWDVDFACWCTYKYLNSGAGCIGGVFLHERHSHNEYPKLTGWWGHKMETRFKMDNVLSLSSGASQYRISNPSAVQVHCLLASLQIFDSVSISALRHKTYHLTGYLEYLLKHYFSTQESSVRVDIITPEQPSRRGAQLSLRFSLPIDRVFCELSKRGVLCDERQPDVLRVAPAPLYNSYRDVHRFVHTLRTVLKNEKNTVAESRE